MLQREQLTYSGWLAKPPTIWRIVKSLGRAQSSAFPTPHEHIVLESRRGRINVGVMSGARYDGVAGLTKKLERFVSKTEQ